MKEDKELILNRTSRAFNSMSAAELLRFNVAKDRIERLQKKSLYIRDYKDETVNEIARIVFKYAPKHDFWEMIIDIFLSDMINLEFNKTPSINRTDKHIFKFFKDIKFNESLAIEKLNHFYQISLSEHTLDLLVCYEEKLKEYESFKNIDEFALILSCLLHDFGKNKKLQEKYSRSTEGFIPHQYISTRYIEDKLKEFQKIYKTKFDNLNDVFFSCMEIMEGVKNAVNEHHTKRSLKAKELVELLIAVDHEARDKEWKDYLNNKGREWIR